MQPRNRIIAALLAIFTGTFGGHKFYLRDTGGFVFFIFLFFMSLSINFPITAIAGLIEGFKLFGMSDEQFNRRYNRGFVKRRDPIIERRRNEQIRKQQKHSRTVRQRQAPQRRKRVRNNPFKKSGLEKYKEFEIKGAIEDFKKGLEIEPDDISLNFNLACAYALMENKEKAFFHLDAAVGNGFNDFERIMKHDDLAFLRIQAEFEQFKNNGFRGTIINKSEPAQNQTQNTTQSSNIEVKDDVLLAQLNRLAELRNKGILSEQEFALERKKLLRN